VKIVTAIDRQQPRFLGRSQPVRLVTSLGDGGSAHTVRVDPDDLLSYGTVVEALRVAPIADDAGWRAELSHLRPNASRVLIGPDHVDRPSLFLDVTARSTTGPGVLSGDPFVIGVEGGRLRSRTFHQPALDAAPSSWPAHEQVWQVLHRFGYPVGATEPDSSGRATWFATFELDHDEELFGCGEDFGPLAKRGTTQRLWLEEAFSNTSHARYHPVPFVWSTAGWGLIVHTTTAVRFDVASRDHSALSVVVDDARALDLVVLTGDSPAEILDTYTELTGRPRRPPRWTFGSWQGRISYASQDEVLAVARELRERRLPCDVIHIDTNWFEHDWACDYRFAPSRFPDPGGMLRQLRDDGFRVSLWQWPNALVGTDTFAEGARAGWLVGGDDGGPYTQPGFVGPAGAIDWSHPGSRAWIAERLRPLLEMGVAAIKTDFGEGAPPTGRYHDLDAVEAHNAYPLLYNDAIAAAMAAVLPDDEWVLWSRSGWAGSQRFPIHWSGDGMARWQDLACVVRSMLSIGLSGVPFYAHDIGGFSGVPTPELYVRWTQLGVLSSHLRFHGFPPREPWAFGDAAEDIVRRWLDLRYRLLPYLWRTADEAATRGLPMCRAMVLAAPHDPTCRRLDDQYLLGEHLLCAPLLDDRDERLVYLPDDGWLDWWDDEPMAAGWHTVHAPLDRAPLYRRAGVDLALAPGGLQSSAELM
jgi:alpha-D-xyloside xylohydrolase